MPRPPETMILAAVSSGRSDFETSRLTNAGQARCPPAPRRFPPARAARGRNRIEGRGAHGDHLDRVLRLHRGERVAGVDRPHEGVGALDRDDVGDLLHVEQRRDARHDVLAVRGRRREDVRVALRHARRAAQRRSRPGTPPRCGASACSTFFTPAICAAALAASPRLVPGDQHVDLAAELLRGGDGVERRLLERLVVVLGEDEDGHQITFASLRSLSTSAFDVGDLDARLALARARRPSASAAGAQRRRRARRASASRASSSSPS